MEKSLVPKPSFPLQKTTQKKKILCKLSQKTSFDDLLLPGIKLKKSNLN